MGSTSTSPPPRKKNLFKGLKRILKRKMVLVQRQEMVRKRNDQTWFPFHSGCHTQGSAQQLQQPSQTSTSYSLDRLKYFFSFSFPLEPFPSTEWESTALTAHLSPSRKSPQLSREHPQPHPSPAGNLLPSPGLPGSFGMCGQQERLQGAACPAQALSTISCPPSNSEQHIPLNPTMLPRPAERALWASDFSSTAAL